MGSVVRGPMIRKLHVLTPQGRERNPLAATAIRRPRGLDAIGTPRPTSRVRDDGEVERAHQVWANFNSLLAGSAKNVAPAWRQHRLGSAGQFLHALAGKPFVECPIKKNWIDGLADVFVHAKP